MNERGALLVTTRSNATGRKMVVYLGGGVLILMGILVLAVPDAFYELSHEYYWLISLILGVVMIAYALFYMITCFLGSRSYCDVYEYSVTGMTGLSRNQPNMPMQKFDIGYKEIQNVTDAGKRICIYTPYATFEVLALHNCSEAVNEIRKRMSGKGI